MLSCTPGMVKLEEKWSGRALMGTVGGSRPPMSPFDLFVRFRLSEDCTYVLHASLGLVVNGETLAMSR